MNEIKQYGWICPKCGRVMSPITTECIYCNVVSRNIVNDTITPNPQYVDVNNTKAISGTSCKDFEIVREIQKYGKIISPIKTQIIK